jgi:hypothetical protein
VFAALNLWDTKSSGVKADIHQRPQWLYFVKKHGDLEVLPELGFGEDAAGFDDFSWLVTSSAFS